MKYIECPSYPSTEDLCMFLAGTITGAPDWQKEIVGLLNDVPVSLLNPRRANFPIHDPTAASQQITWEHQMLRRANMILFWFSKETMGPIVLYELGAHSMTPKPLVVGMDMKYPRRQDVEIQTKLVRPEVPIVYTLKDLAAQARTMCDTFVNKNLWKK